MVQGKKYWVVILFDRLRELDDSVNTNLMRAAIMWLSVVFPPPKKKKK